MKIAIDAMGGDHAPKAAIFGSLEAIKTSPKSLDIILLGDETLIRKELNGNYSRETGLFRVKK